MTSRRRVRHTRTQIHEHTHTHIHTGTHTNVKHEHIKLKPKFLGNIWILDLFYVMCYMLVDTYNYIVQSQITIDYYKIYTLRLKLYLFFCSVFQRTVGWIHVLEELGLTNKWTDRQKCYYFRAEGYLNKMIRCILLVHKVFL